MASEEGRIILRKRDAPLRQPSDEYLNDTPDSVSMDDIPINEYSDDNIDDIVEANTMIESNKKNTLFNPRKSGGKASQLTGCHSWEDAVNEFADDVGEEEAQAIIASGTLKRKNRHSKSLTKTPAENNKSINTEHASKPEHKTGVRRTDDEQKAENRTEDEDITEESDKLGNEDQIEDKQKTKDDEKIQDQMVKAEGEADKMDEEEMSAPAVTRQDLTKGRNTGKVLESVSKTLRQRLGKIPTPFSKRTNGLSNKGSGSSPVPEPSPSPPPPPRPPLPPPPPPPPPAKAESHPHGMESDAEDNDEKDDDDLVAHTVATVEKVGKHNGGRLENTRINMSKLIGGESEGGKECLSVSVCSKKPDFTYRSALTRLLCGLYALFLVVIALVFAVASSLSDTHTHRLYYLQVFLLYLYLGSLVILLYLQLCVLRKKQVSTKSPNNSLRIVIRRDPDHSQGALPLTIPQGNYPSIHGVPPPTPVDLPGKDQGFEPKHPVVVRRPPPPNVLNFRSNVSSFRSSGFDFRFNASDFRSNASDFRSRSVLRFDGSVAHVGEGINFFLRLGALGFSLGSVTMDGLHLASDLEGEGGVSACRSPLFLPVHLCHLLFTFLQTFFLFKNHRLAVGDHQGGLRWCVVHLLSTNLCVWLVTVVIGTAHHYRHQQEQDYLDTGGSHLGNATPSHLKSCYRDVTLARAASPYLFPCTVIYSIIAAGILYRIYTAHVGIKSRQRWSRYSRASFTSSVAPQGMVLMDCEKAHKGLFSGLLVAVGTLIAIATFFVLDTRLNKPVSAMKVFFALEMTLLLLTCGGLVAGLRQLQTLRFLKTSLDAASSSSLDIVLLLLTLSGVYLYLGFRLLSAASSLDGHPLVSVLSVLSLLLELLQTTLQVVFVLDGMGRRAWDELQMEQKPGRAAVTFVLVCNLAQWVVTLFETRRAKVLPLHLAFYGTLPWTIILHVCVPLYIYFRFHSAICLSKIWYHAYTKGD